MLIVLFLTWLHSLHLLIEINRIYVTNHLIDDVSICSIDLFTYIMRYLEKDDETYVADVRKWYGHKNMRGRKLFKKKMSSYYIVTPIHYNDNHWLVMFTEISNGDKKIHCYLFDSFGPKTNTSSKVTGIQRKIQQRWLERFLPIAAIVEGHQCNFVEYEKSSSYIPIG